MPPKKAPTPEMLAYQDAVEAWHAARDKEADLRNRFNQLNQELACAVQAKEQAGRTLTTAHTNAMNARY